MSCGVGHRPGSGLVLLRLWCRLAALIRPLAWEPPYAMGVGLKKTKKNNNNDKNDFPTHSDLRRRASLKDS